MLPVVLCLVGPVETEELRKVGMIINSRIRMMKTIMMIIFQDISKKKVLLIANVTHSKELNDVKYTQENRLNQETEVRENTEDSTTEHHADLENGVVETLLNRETRETVID